jgi:hypothetical protein
MLAPHQREANMRRYKIELFHIGIVCFRGRLLARAAAGHIERPCEDMPISNIRVDDDNHSIFEE